MGYTSFTVDKLEKIIAEYNPKSVIDLGAQNMFNQPLLPAPYAREWYKEKKIRYDSIDLNKENYSIPLDLSKEYYCLYERHSFYIYGYDLVVDAGTSEHVRGTDDKFSWEAIYNCWKIKHDLLKVGGIMYNENPKTGNWPLHGQNYYTEEFYKQLSEFSDYEILEIGEHAAMNNYVDGWNIFCVLKKKSKVFPSLYSFKGFKLMQS